MHHSNEGQKSKIKASEELFLFWNMKRNNFSWLFLAADADYQSLAFLVCNCFTPTSASPSHGILPISLCIPMAFFSFYKEIGSTRLRAHPNNLILTWLYLRRPYFKIRSYLQVQELGLQHKIWGQGVCISTHRSCILDKIHILSEIKKAWQTNANWKSKLDVRQGKRYLWEINDI